MRRTVLQRLWWLSALCAGMTAGAGAEPTLLLTEAIVHTVSGAVLTNGQVLVEGATIREVGGALARQADQTISLRGLHLYPGLIAASSTLGLVEIEAARATRDTTEVGAFTPEVASWLAVNPDSELIPVARANGITHALVVPSGGVVAGRSGLVQLDGWTTEQMLVRGPAALHVYWPSAELDLTPRERLRDRSRFKSLEDQARERKVRARELDDFFLEALAYLKAKQAGEKGGAFQPVPAWEAMLPFVRGELPVFVHADSVREIKAALAWAKERQLRLVLIDAREAWRVAAEIAQNQVPVIYSDVFTLPSSDDASYAVHFRAPGILHAAGVKLVFGMGGRFESSSLRNLPYLAGQAVAFGLPEDVALRALTMNPAEVLGVAERIGSLQSGREATMFASDGPILDIRAQVKHLWIAGREVDLASRHTRLYERYRNRPKAP